MFLTLFLCGLFILIEEYLSAIIMIIIMLFVEVATSGNYTMLYVAEVAVDSGAGFASLGKYINLLIMIMAHEYLVNSSL